VFFEKKRPMRVVAQVAASAALVVLLGGVRAAPRCLFFEKNTGRASDVCAVSLSAGAAGSRPGTMHLIFNNFD
jgi:hypothetical protein